MRAKPAVRDLGEHADVKTKRAYRERIRGGRGLVTAAAIRIAMRVACATFAASILSLAADEQAKATTYSYTINQNQTFSANPGYVGGYYYAVADSSVAPQAVSLGDTLDIKFNFSGYTPAPSFGFQFGLFLDQIGPFPYVPPNFTFNVNWSINGVLQPSGTTVGCCGPMDVRFYSYDTSAPFPGSSPYPGGPLNQIELLLTLTSVSSQSPSQVFTLDYLEGDANFNWQAPLPAALPLFATGLGVLGLLGWRRKRKAIALAA
jgi:hypothetical protein